ncbi:MAG: hypothetical protein ACE366_05315 [Bradymonadia bacterium]
MKQPIYLLVLALSLAGGGVACNDLDNTDIDPIETEGDAALDTRDARTLPDVDLPDGEVIEFPDAVVPDAEPGEPDGEVLDMAPLIDAAVPPPVVRSIQTRLGTPSTAAGRGNRVTCEALDEEGFPIGDVITRFEVRPPEGWSRPPAGEDGVVPNELIGAQAGVYQVTCLAPQLGLRDQTPARWDVLPGAPARLRAVADSEVTTAGETVTVTCEALDAAGNPVPVPEAVLVVSPDDPGNEIVYPDPENGGPIELNLTVAGRYTVACAYKDASADVVAEIEVLPGPPAQLLASLAPERAVYAIGQVVELVTLITDRYGNIVPDAPLTWGAEPPIAGFGEGRFRPQAEGLYRVGVTVQGPTDGNRMLEAWLDLVVDAGGPAISCDGPEPGGQIAVRPGETVRLEGRVDDVVGVERLTVDGAVVPVAADGRFSVDVGVPAWGLNLHQVVAEDAGGQDNSIWCTYFASPTYQFERDPVQDSIRLTLAREAIDDGPPANPLGSIGDLLRALVESEGLIQTLDESLRAQNPIVPNTCQTRILGRCIFSIGAEYRGLDINGARTTSLSPIDGGLRATLRLDDVVLDARLLGTLGNRGTISASFIEVFLTFDVDVVRGQPQITLRDVERLRIGNLDADFEGVITGTLLNLIFDAFESLVRNELTSALRDFLELELDALLTDVLAGFDIAALSAAFPIPDPNGGAPVPITVSVQLSSVTADPDGLALGVLTQTAGRIGEGGRSLGVPMPPESANCLPVDSSPPAQPRTASALIRVAFLNQMLHRVWRAGLFRLEDAGALGEGVSASFRLRVPPAAELPVSLRPDLRVHLGPLEGELGYAGLFDEPIRFSVSAILDVPVALADEDGVATLTLGAGDGVTISDFALDFPGVVVTAQARPALESVLLELVESLVLQGLAEALPSLPIPDFALPDDLADFGIPPGTRLGLDDLRLRHHEGCWLLEGGLAR